MRLDIRNDELRRLAKERAQLTGETETVAITNALREWLALKGRGLEVDAHVEELHVIGRRHAKLLKPGPSAAERGNLLCDDRSMPE